MSHIRFGESFMKRFLFITSFFISVSVSSGQVWTEDFETNGLGTLYTSASVFTNNVNAHYNRTNGANISETSGAYFAQHGTFYWAGENQNDNSVAGNGLPIKVILFSNINVAGLTGLQFKGLFASGNIGAGHDYSDSFYVEYRMDTGVWTRLLQFSAPSASSNVGLAYDGDLNNIGEGAFLTPQFTQYAANIPVTGTTLQIRITTTNNSIGEEVAFDYLRVYASNSPVNGCTNPLASNFNPSATIDNNSCIFPGCTDASALNFDPTATSNNGSCVYTVPQIVINEIHYNPSFYGNFSDNVYEFIELHNPGTTSVSLAGWRIGRAIDFTFPAGASIAAGGYVLVSPSATTYAAAAPLYVYTGTLNNSGDILELYTPQRILVDRAAYFPTTPWPAGPDGNGPSLELINPMLDNMNLYNWCGVGQTNGTPGAQNSCYSLIAGCTDPIADNYNSNAQTNDNSCRYPGCTYGSATNYNANANVDDGSCFYPTVIIIPGCTYPNATNYNPAANTENQTCIFPSPQVIPGCTYAAAINYNPNANVDDQTCLFPSPVVITGCTYPAATNYDPAANTDDQSCIFPQPEIIPGCTYPGANNYNPTANTDDLSCDFTLLVSPCVGDFDEDGAVTVLDLSVFLAIFGQTCN